MIDPTVQSMRGQQSVDVPARGRRAPTSRRAFLFGSAALAGAHLLGGSLAAAGAGTAPKNNAADDPPQDRPGRTPHTQFAVNLEMWFRGPFEERIVEAARLGFPAVEFWPYPNRDIDRMAKLLGEHNMVATQFTAWGFGTELNNPKANADSFLKAIEESCHVAERLPGCELFTVVLGNDIPGIAKEAMHAAAIEKIRRAVPLLEQHRKWIIIEPMNPYNHPHHCLYGSRDGIAVCRAIDSPWVKLNWDLFHMQRFEGNLIDNLRKGKDFIGYVQLADSPARHEPGTGEINYTKVFQTLQEIGYQRPVGLECTPEGGDVLRAARRVYAADTW